MERTGVLKYREQRNETTQSEVPPDSELHVLTFLLGHRSRPSFYASPRRGTTGPSVIRARM